MNFHELLEQYPQFVRNHGIFFEFYDGEYWIDERWVCHSCLEQRLLNNKTPKEAEEKYCMGIYAGKYCNTCWDKSGYRKDAKFDPDDAGEIYWEDQY